MHLGGHVAWADAIDANAVRTELTGQGVREGDHSRLGGSVDARPGGRVTTEDGADRDDATRSGGNHGAGSGAAAEEGAVEVDADNLAIRLIAHLGDRAAAADTGVGHEEIEAAQSRDGCLQPGNRPGPASRTSQTAAKAPLPSRDAASETPSSTSAMKTAMPSRSSRRAMSRPSPRAAPVTMATRAGAGGWARASEVKVAPQFSICCPDLAVNRS